MKLLTVPAWHPDQWVIPVTQVSDDLCALGCRTLLSRTLLSSGSLCGLCVEGFVPFRGRIAIATHCPKSDPLDFHGSACPDCNGIGHLIVASAVVDDCVPIVDPHKVRAATKTGCASLTAPRPALDPPKLIVWVKGDVYGTDISDQLAFATFTPGMSALILSDVQPTIKRCPHCDGIGNRWAIEGSPRGYEVWPVCSMCDGYGTCDPIPVAAGPTWREWTP